MYSFNIFSLNVNICIPLYTKIVITKIPLFFNIKSNLVKIYYLFEFKYTQPYKNI